MNPTARHTAPPPAHTASRNAAGVRHRSRLFPLPERSLHRFCGVLLSFGVAASSGCALHPPTPTPTTDEQPPLLQPSTLEVPHTTEQVLRVAYAQHDTILRCVIRTTPAQIELIALTALGQRALTVSWDGQNWSVDASPLVPSNLHPQWLLADLQLALWPLQTLRQRYASAGWKISEPGGGMRLLRHDGKIVAAVSYADADPWHGRYWIMNFRYNYALSIEADSTSAAP